MWDEKYKNSNSYINSFILLSYWCNKCEYLTTILEDKCDFVA